MADLVHIVRSDNFARETIDEKFERQNVERAKADEIAKALNQEGGLYGAWYYRTVPLDYKLQVFEP